VSPLGIIELIYPQNAKTDTRRGINIFKQVRRGAALCRVAGGGRRRSSRLRWGRSAAGRGRGGAAVAALQRPPLTPPAAAPPAPRPRPPKPALRAGALNTIQQRRIVINGPLKLVQGNFGTIARIPIFVPNSSLAETFGTNRSRERARRRAGASLWGPVRGGGVTRGAADTRSGPPCSPQTLPTPPPCPSPLTHSSDRLRHLL
jgi:hypothetical protein